MTTKQQLRNWSLAAVLTVLAPVVALAQGAPEGLKVHGHWVLEVHNPDGTFVERREFDNALFQSTPTAQQGGNSALAGMMGGLLSNPQWSVTLSQFGDLLGATSGPCAGPCAASQHDGNVTVAVPTAPYLPGSGLLAPTGKVELSGSVNANSGGIVGWVSTTLFATFSGSGRLFGFSGHVLEQPLTVAPGQIVQFKVVFSFS